MFWAYEFGFKEGIDILEQIGVSRYTADAQGKTAPQMAHVVNINKEHLHDHFAEDEDDGEMDDDAYSGDEF